MGSIPDALTFLESVSGYARRQNDNGAADRPPRLATVDPTFDVASGLLPRVTFDGEESLTVKRYPFYGGYIPCPGDRVILFPVGNTYWILGSVNNPGRQGFYADQENDTYRLYLSGSVYFEVTFGVVLQLMVDGSKISLPRTKFLQSDHAGVNNSTTLVPTNLSFPLLAWANYHFRVRAKYTAGTSEDFKPGLILPTGATFDYLPMSIESGNADETGDVYMGNMSSSHVAAAPGVNASTPLNALIEGMIFMGSTAGDGVFAYAQASAGAGTTTTLRRGSVMTVSDAVGV